MQVNMDVAASTYLKEVAFMAGNGGRECKGSSAASSAREFNFWGQSFDDLEFLKDLLNGNKDVEKAELMVA